MQSPFITHEVGGVMQDTVINAHRLIGETVREPGHKHCGRIVGVDQARAVPVLFVVWQQREGVERVELSVDELRGLSDACMRQSPERGLFSPVSRDESPEIVPMPPRRVGTR